MGDGSAADNVRLACEVKHFIADCRNKINSIPDAATDLKVVGTTDDRVSVI